MRLAEAPATVAITIVTVLVSAAVLLSGHLGEAAFYGGFIPLRFDPAFSGAHDFIIPAWLTPLTATLLHGGIAHIALNLVILAYCGFAVERAIGTVGLIALYLIGAYAAALGHWSFGPHSVTPVIGASGAISAVLATYALLFGERRAKAIGPVPAGVVHVVWLAAAWIGIQALIGVAGLGGFGAIAIGAHIGGFIGGLILARPLLLWRYRGA